MPKKKPSDKNQKRMFIKTAKDLGSDESGLKINDFRHQARGNPGARLWDSIPDRLYLAVRGDSNIVERVLPRAQAGDPEAQCSALDSRGALP